MNKSIKTITALVSICLLALVIFKYVSIEQTQSLESVKSEQTLHPENSAGMANSDKSPASEGVAAETVQAKTNNMSTTTTPAPKLSPEIREALSKILDTSSEGLVEEPGPQGSVLIKFQGHFQTAPVATIDAEGNVHIRDYSSVPTTGNQQ